MNDLAHLLNIGSLATWLSVAGFGTVGVMLPEKQPARVLEAAKESVLVPEDFELGGETPAAATEPDSEPAATAPAEPLPAPPELPAIAETAPLPTVPSLPDAPAGPAETPQFKPVARRSSGSPENPNPSGRRVGNGRAGAGNSGMSSAARVAAGHMPAPNYPPAARRNGQTGTVVVQFTVDSNGRVTFANAVRPSPWPLLNQEAVSTVLLWRFPPGDFITLERPIVFRLK